LGDFAIGGRNDPGPAIAFLSAIRPSHRSLRISGFVGRADIHDPASYIAGKILLPRLRFTHLLNVPQLLEPSFLDDERVCEGVADFLAALGAVFRQLRAGDDLPGMDRVPLRRDIFIAPMS
jgi:hypothetical protein